MAASAVLALLAGGGLLLRGARRAVASDALPDVGRWSVWRTTVTGGLGPVEPELRYTWVVEVEPPGRTKLGGAVFMVQRLRPDLRGAIEEPRRASYDLRAGDWQPAGEETLTLKGVAYACTRRRLVVGPSTRRSGSAPRSRPRRCRSGP